MNREEIDKLIARARAKSVTQVYDIFIRTLPCCICNPQGSPHQGGKTEAAHVSRAAERGIAAKSEYATIPLCTTCHHLQHVKGELAVLKMRFMMKAGRYDKHSISEAKEWFDKKRIEMLKSWLGDEVNG